jgi:hypothetical protein
MTFKICDILKLGIKKRSSKSKDWQKVCQQIKNVEQEYIKIDFINDDES